MLINQTKMNPYNIFKAFIHFINKLRDGYLTSYKTIDPKSFDSNDSIEVITTIGGITYYRFTDPVKMPAGRYYHAYNFMQENTMNCDREFLISIYEVIENALSAKSGEIKLTDIARANFMLKERLTQAYVPDLVMKIASVLFFDKNENIEGYDLKYNMNKIEHWRKHKEDADFFLQMPLEDYMPQSEEFSQLLQTYTITANMMSRKQMDELLEMRLKESTKNERESLSKLVKK